VNFKQIYLKNHGNAEACLLTTLWTFAYQYSSLIGPFVKLAWIHCLCHVCFIIKNNIPSMTNKPFPFKMGAHASGRDRMVVGFKTTYICNQCKVYKVCQWLATGRWYSPGPLVSSTNKTDRHDITEILLKVA